MKKERLERFGLTSNVMLSGSVASTCPSDEPPSAVGRVAVVLRLKNEQNKPDHPLRKKVHMHLFMGLIREVGLK
jgi:hypothetical protein